MEKQININEDVLCVLRKGAEGIIIDYIPIDNPYKDELEELKDLCFSDLNNIKEIITFLNTPNRFKILKLDVEAGYRTWDKSKYYSYCEDLTDSYQGLRVLINNPELDNYDFGGEFKFLEEGLNKLKDTGINLNEIRQIVAFARNPNRVTINRNSQSGYTFTDDIIFICQYFFLFKRTSVSIKSVKEAKKRIKENIYRNFKLWNDAYNIKEAYEKCGDVHNINYRENNTILAYSHRKVGWSNPEYQLSDNFTFELKTNFGYGGSSYFFVKMKYKDIDITPISEWINYEFAKFSQVIRYSKSFLHKEWHKTSKNWYYSKLKIKDSSWKGAMEYVMTACNCSLRSEKEFIQTYVVEECEQMVLGLQKIVKESKFKFSNERNDLPNNEPHYEVDMKGHQLISFRGEKVSGALDFISKIVEYIEITEINVFIEQIKKINIEIQPLLKQEYSILINELKPKNEELVILEQKYILEEEKNKAYTGLKNMLKGSLVKNKNYTYTLESLDREFELLYPKYKDFKKEFEKISNDRVILRQKIRNLNNFKDNIKSYEEKISNYFK